MDEGSRDESQKMGSSLTPQLNSDLLVPQMYPDATLFRGRLEKMTSEDRKIQTRITKDKATFQVIAPYLRILQKKYLPVHLKAPTKPSKAFMPKKSFFEAFTGAFDAFEQFEMIITVHETADVLRTLLSASNVVSYFINPFKNEMFQSPRHVASFAPNLSRQIKLGTTIAAYAACTKKYVISHNISADSRFPEGLGFPGSMTKFAMCVPIVCPDEDHSVFAVYEITRDAYSYAFSERDLQIVLCITGWMGYSILENNLYTSLIRKHELSKYLLFITNFFHSNLANVIKTISDLVIFARDTIKAERGSLYVVEKITLNSITIEEYDQVTEKSIFKRQNKKVVEQDQSVLSTVLFGKKIMNKYYKNVSITSETEHITKRSVLCVPIINKDRILGAVQLTNKKTATAFSKEDEVTLQKFAMYCTTNLLHSKIHERTKKSTFESNCFEEVLLYHMRPCEHDQEVVVKQKLSKLKRTQLPKNFFSFSWYPSDKSQSLMELTLVLFHEVLGDGFMTTNDVPLFVLTVQKGYRPNPYHNFKHAFCVLHTMANILFTNPGYFTGAETVALMIAALCHDVDHRGLTNNFLHLTSHNLASLYSFLPLENQNFAVTKMILHKCKMFINLPLNSYKEILDYTHECILATDLTNCYKTRKLINVDQNNRKYVMSIMMTACDLSGFTKPFEISKEITDNMYEEFYHQGDLEKKLGFELLPVVDREKINMIAENQLQFVAIVVLPCLKTLTSIFSNTKPMLSQCKKILAQWKELIEIKSLHTWKPEESYIK